MKLFLCALGIALAAASYCRAAASSPWTYSNDTNAMGDKTLLACTKSHEIIHQDPPYRSTHAVLCATYSVQAPMGPIVGVMITLEGKGLIRQEEFRFKFNNYGPYLHSVTDDETNQSLVPDWPKTFIGFICGATTLVVELPVYSGGIQYATFDVSGLKFPDFGPTEAEQARQEDPALAASEGPQTPRSPCMPAPAGAPAVG